MLLFKQRGFLSLSLNVFSLFSLLLKRRFFRREDGPGASLSLSLSLSLSARVYYEPARRRMRVDLSLSLCRQNSRTKRSFKGLGFRTLNVSVVGEIRPERERERERERTRARGKTHLNPVLFILEKRDLFLLLFCY
jgi:hypothetical protein